MRRWLQILLALFCLSPGAESLHAQTSSDDDACRNLVIYRDTKLFAEFDRSLRQWSVASQALQDTSALRAQLRSDSRWLQAAEIGGTLLHTVNILTAALQATLDLATLGQQGKVSAVGRAAASEIVEQVKRTGTAIELIQAKKEGEVAEVIVGEIPVLGSALKFFKSIEEGRHFAESVGESKRVVNQQLDTLSRSLSRIASSVERFKRNAQLQNEVRALIDGRCGKQKSTRTLVASTQNPTPSILQFDKPVSVKPTNCAILGDTKSVQALTDSNLDELQRLMSLCPRGP